MFDHVGPDVRDYSASRRSYEQALVRLAFHVVLDGDDWRAVGFGTADKPTFRIVECERHGTGADVAVRCDDRDTVDDFHPAALAAGGNDNRAPGGSRAQPIRPTTARVRPRPGRQQRRGGPPRSGAALGPGGSAQ